jgi:osmoprotectant transport system permease protein
MGALFGAVTMAAPVIPTFKQQSSCVTNPKALFCPSWVADNWGSVLEPKLVQHIEMTAIAVAIGLVLAFLAALAAYRYGWFERLFTGFSTILYTIPSLAFFELFVPLTGLTLLTIEIGLVGYTLLALFGNILTGLRETPPEAIAAAKGMGMTDRQILWKVSIPLAMPSIMAGIRVATVITISLATIAAYITPWGLGQPITEGISTSFNTELIAAGGLAILLALVADALLVGLQRLVTPWRRARAGGK